MAERFGTDAQIQEERGLSDCDICGQTLMYGKHLRGQSCDPLWNLVLVGESEVARHYSPKGFPAGKFTVVVAK